MIRPARPMPAPGDLPGDADDFAAFYRRSYPAARQLAHLLTNGSADAEDLVQDAFGRLHGRFEQLDNPDAYLRRTIVNGCRQRFRSRNREDARIRLVASGGTRVETTVDPMLDTVATLPRRQRAAIVLRYWADLDDDAIADALGVRRSTVRSLVHRGLAVLRKELEP